MYAGHFCKRRQNELELLQLLVQINLSLLVYDPISLDCVLRKKPSTSPHHHKEVLSGLLHQRH